jgi:carbon-monoxide dehydrogenase iron sulfur subunit
MIGMKFKIIVHPERCTGCRICELFCSAFHEKVFNPKKARIRVVRLKPAIDMPVTCQQCKKAPCAEICPVDAIIVNEVGVVQINYEKCIGCTMCVEACPFGAMFVNPETNTPIKCDLCDGDPQCVKHCPTGALEFISPDQNPQKKREKFVRTRVRNSTKI